MDYKDLYIKLNNAYTEENLNRISTKIIDLYKRREYDAIRGLMQKIRRIISFNEKRINKIFSRLIMLYHPDKLNYYKNEIEKYYKAGKLELLFQFSHILFIIEDEKYLSEEEIINFENIVSDDIYWGFNDEDLVFIDDIESNITDQGKGSLHREYEYSDFDFFSALKRKEFGNLDVDFQYHHLEDIEGELELSDYEINDLTGIEYCKYVTSLDLSDNNIADISNMNNLRLLEELYLSNNYIDNIQILRKLKNLKVIDLSDNDIEDISPLFDLNKLEYINLMGNKIPENQKIRLEENGVVVVS